jgi:hypothetical protein
VVELKYSVRCAHVDVVSEQQSEAARARWSRSTAEDRRRATAPAVERSVERRRAATDVLRALESLRAAGFTFVLSDDDDDGLPR